VRIKELESELQEAKVTISSLQAAALAMGSSGEFDRGLTEV
jgi:hypothetical protein